MAVALGLLLGMGVRPAVAETPTLDPALTCAINWTQHVEPRTTPITADRLASLWRIVVHPDCGAPASLAGLEQATNLTQFELSQPAGTTRTTDLTPLMALRQLTALTLTHVTLRDPAQLAQLPRLRSFTVITQAPFRISLLAGMRDLEILTVYSPGISGTDLLGNFTKLHYLGLVGTSVPLQHLAPLTQLTMLSVGGGKQTDVRPLARLVNLEGLSLDVPATDLSPLAGLRKLETLSLIAPGVSDVGFLRGLTRLTSLRLEGNPRITDIAPMAHLTALEQLEVSMSRVRSVQPLAGLKKLRELFFENNAVTDLSPLAGIPGLEVRGRQHIAVPVGQLVSSVRVIGIDGKRVPLTTFTDERGLPIATWEVQLPSSTPYSEFWFSGTIRTDPTLTLDLYGTDGEFMVNGRRWRTSCEKYSATSRCRTEIWATTVAQVNGRFVQSSGWVFNNLTYLPMPKAAWGTNPLANTGTWTATDGRRWRTECGTALTGRNGCRSWVEARVITNVAGAGEPVRWGWTTIWVLNNMVRLA